MRSFLLLLFLLLWISVDGVAHHDDGFLFADKGRLCFIILATLMAACPYEFGLGSESFGKGADYHINRKRRPVYDIFRELGPGYVRRAYRMDAASFWELHQLLLPHLKKKKSRKKKHRNGAPNGLISLSARLSAAIRYFAGGRAEDIALVHGISHTEVYECVWRVVNAVNNCPALDISFPSNYEKQREIAQGFHAKSKVGF